jgi:Mrp family chromosome partitioning ATPase
MAPNADLESVVHKAGSLDVIAADAPSADSHLLFPGRAPELLARLGRRYRYVIVDAPPVLPMVDGHLLAEAVDRVLFVVRSRKTPREVVERAMELFDRSGIIGVVLNDVSLGGRKYAAAYHYYEKHYAHAAAKGTAA